LNVQKRRIYDITNVMVGVGLIEKKNPNCIQWKKDPTWPKEYAREPLVRDDVMAEEISQLDNHEKILDQYIDIAEQSMRNIQDYANLYNLGYLTQEDLKGVFPGHTIFGIKSPSGTQLEVTQPEAILNGKEKYQMHLKTDLDEIIVVMIDNEEQMKEVNEGRNLDRFGVNATVKNTQVEIKEEENLLLEENLEEYVPNVHVFEGLNTDTQESNDISLPSIQMYNPSIEENLFFSDFSLDFLNPSPILSLEEENLFFNMDSYQ